jgi:hypothetical protein
LAFIRHQANASSGGQVTDIEIATFLSGAIVSRTGSSTPRRWGLDRRSAEHGGRGRTAGREPGKGMVRCGADPVGQPCSCAASR